MRVTDDVPEHAATIKTTSILISVLNSAPIADIKSPTIIDEYDSSEMVVYQQMDLVIMTQFVLHSII